MPQFARAEPFTFRFEQIAKNSVIATSAGRAVSGDRICRGRRDESAFPAKPGFGVPSASEQLEHGLLCRCDPHWSGFGPALTGKAEEIDEMMEVLDTSIGEILEE